MDIRRKSLAFFMGPDLLHYALGLDEDLIHQISLLEELQCLAIDYKCMCNDLVSREIFVRDITSDHGT